jgi:predicted nucleic acid-binding protein
MSAERSVPNRIFIDTLFVITLINLRDQYHQQALDLAEQFEGAPLLVTDAVLLEIGNALARSYKQEAVEIIEQSLAAKEVGSVCLSTGSHTPKSRVMARVTAGVTARVNIARSVGACSACLRWSNVQTGYLEA